MVRKKRTQVYTEELALKARNGKAFRYGRSSYSNSNVEGNALTQQFNTERINRKWVSDINYIRIRGKWLYLIAVMDLFSRALSVGHMGKLISDAFNMALLVRREVKPGLMLHSDRYVQCSTMRWPIRI
ncbi:hypothetical protein MHM93_00080 [Pseudoalteromonas sp. MM17-2]|uniref:hypothetical protein n=1 Tax=Pseudoalteromonas sp. MM17-2 TaxID=2917753 RepID=UPI001EF3DA9F|nr:hypothetical protein [Pseudoalteromonas sp. MM17-2]MCG7542576.1 hypothetical protein [Pseudoalteromonas sp. MM17-2]